jgi:hypothetical protein
MIVFVSARMRARVPAALGPLQGASRVLVVPGRLASRHPAFVVAGCSGYVLGGRGDAESATARSRRALGGRA